MENGKWAIYFLSFVLVFTQFHTQYTATIQNAHTNTHSLTHTLTHTYNNKQSNADASCAASSKSLLSLAKRTTTITSKQRRRQQQLRCSTQKKIPFSLWARLSRSRRCRRRFRLLFELYMYLLYFIVVVIIMYIFDTLQCYCSHSFINDFFTFLPQYKNTVASRRVNFFLFFLFVLFLLSKETLTVIYSLRLILFEYTHAHTLCTHS